MNRIGIALAFILVVIISAAACIPAATPPTPTAASTTAAKAATSPSPTPTTPPKPTVTPTKVPPEKVKLNYPSSGLSFSLALIAQDKGYFQQEGLDVELLQMTSGPAIKSLIGGGHDFDMSLGSAKVAIIQGAPLKLVFIGRGTPFYINAKPAIKTIADLKGKRIGLESQGTILHVLAKVALRKNGVDPDKDVNWIGIGVGAAPAVAMKAGTVDATVLTDSYALQLEAEGFPVLAALRDYVNGPSGGVAVREDMLKSKPQTVKKMVRAMLKAQAYLKSQTPDSRAYIIDFLVKGGMQKDLAAILYDREVKQFTDSGWLPDDILKADIDIVKESLESTGDKIEGSFGVDKLYDLSIVKQAADDLKKEGWKP